MLVIGLLSVCLASRADDHNKRVPDKERYGFFIADNHSWTRIPFQLHSNLIIVPVRVNDSDTLRFILDTGVSNTIITDPSAFRKKPLTLTRKVKLAGAGEGGSLTASIAIDNTLSMGGLRAAHHNLVLLDEDILKLSEYVGTPVHGIFGYEIFANFVVNIDFQGRGVTGQRIVNGVGCTGKMVHFGAGISDIHADIAEADGGCRVQLQGEKVIELLVGVDLLFNAGESDQLLGKLCRVHRVQRILVLQLRRQQGQELVKVRAQRGR